MTCQVGWLQSALNDLTNIWTAADSKQRRAITDAVSAIDQQLEQDAHAQGESRPDGSRVLFVPPIGLTFRADFRGQLAVVVHVWRLTKRKKH